MQKKQSGLQANGQDQQGQEENQEKQNWIGKRAKKFQRFFRNFDFIGSEVKLNYEDKDKYRTGFGGNYDNDPAFLALDPTDTIFAVKVAQDNFTTRPYFNVTMQYCHYSRSEGGNMEKIKNTVEMVPCTKEHFTQLYSAGDVDWSEVFDFQGLNDHLCPPLNYTLSVGGMYTSQDFYFVKYVVDQCKNQTTVIDDSVTYSSACAPQEEIDEFISGVNQNFQIYYPSTVLSPDNTEKPIQRFLYDQMYFELQAGKMYKSANIYFREVTIETDESIYLWNDKQNQTFAMFQPNDFREQVQTGEDLLYGEFYIRRSPYTVVYHREYQKLDDIASYIGGFSEVFIVMATVIVGFYNETTLSISLANKLYHFKYSKDKKQQEKQDEEFMGAVNQLQNGKNGQFSSNNDNSSSSNSNGKSLEQNHKIIQVEDSGKNVGQSKIQSSIGLKNNPKTFERQRSSLKVKSIRQIIEERQQIINNLQQEKRKSQEYNSENNFQNQDDEINQSKDKKVQKSGKLKKAQFFQRIEKNGQDIKFAETRTPENNNNKNSKNNNQDGKIYSLSSEEKKKLYEGLGFKSKKEFLDNQFGQLQEKNKSKVNLTVKYFLNKIFCDKFFQNEEVEMIKEARKRVRQDLDIQLVLECIKEIQKIKDIQYDSDQQVLFNFFPKPTLKVEKYYNEEKFKQKKQLERKKFEQYMKRTTNFSSQNKKKFDDMEKYYSLYRTYLKLTKSKKNNKLNQKLIQQLGKKIREIFETSNLIDFEENELDFGTPLIQNGKSIQQIETPVKIKNIKNIAMDQEKNNDTQEQNSKRITEQKEMYEISQDNSFCSKFQQDSKNQGVGKNREISDTVTLGQENSLNINSIMNNNYNNNQNNNQNNNISNSNFDGKFRSSKYKQSNNQQQSTDYQTQSYIQNLCQNQQQGQKKGNVKKLPSIVRNKQQSIYDPNQSNLSSFSRLGDETQRNLIGKNSQMQLQQQQLQYPQINKENDVLGLQNEENDENGSDLDRSSLVQVPLDENDIESKDASFIQFKQKSQQQFCSLSNINQMFKQSSVSTIQFLKSQRDNSVTQRDDIQKISEENNENQEQTKK
ncbi:hypothetical protein PPERSA_03743 [Pseudocohnilembus persalinus]|uniref:Uncharacterized protein n=1 Tax=Pseudocohnilembus persalinus TaxID=266149 RepID=A0A0V0QHK6_PSEPJ|nr:hypothetical protein PPERSA_03743 [Pseudocohnilembus persalinus]|eukprot:KRX01659.1 hypothetical protein PPERSA_03743 [Pseudocohnilembus persalinus]